MKLIRNDAVVKISMPRALVTSRCSSSSFSSSRDGVVIFLNCYEDIVSIYVYIRY